jgi:uncharacterized surface protein with fasciclin (FAS1) repeats
MGVRRVSTIAATFVLMACGSSDGAPPMPSPGPNSTAQDNIIEALAADGRFDTLVRLLSTDAGSNCCVHLKRVVPVTNLTVFAPTDEAFAALPPGALEAMIDDDLRLLRLMENHLVHGIVTSRALQAGDLSTVAGTVKIAADDGTLTFAGAKILEPELVAENGIIHPIEGVATRYCVQVTLSGPPECHDLTRSESH